MKKSKKDEAKMEETAAMARLKQSYQQQQRQQQSSQGTNRALHDLASPKMKKVRRRLEDLQDEKAKLEEMIHKLNSRKQKQQELLQRQREYHQATAAPTKSNGDDDLLPVSNDDDDDDDDYDEAKKSHKKKSKKRNGKKSNYSINYAASSVVSSLQSRAASYESNDDSEDDYEDENNNGNASDDASVLAENSSNNESYRYDARGRRILEDDLLETATTAACFQNVTGTNNHTTHETMIPSFSGHSNSTQNKGKKSKSNPEQQKAEDDLPRVTIEWKRGISYLPEANLAYEGGGGADNVYLHHHATDLSLLVVEDNSYWDDLSLSSGEDSCLAAAEPDVPMVLNLSAKQGENGDDDWSVQSGLHSECSVSVAVAPFTTNNNKTTNDSGNKAPPVPSISASSQSKSSRRRGGGDAGGIPTTLQTPNHTPALALYQRTNTNDMDESTDNAVPMKYALSSTRQKSPRRKKRNGKKVKDDDDDDGLPPPLTTDMSLVDSRPGDDDASQNKTSAAPPIEISFPEEGGKDDDGLVSSGSAMCGVSVTQHDQAPSGQEPTAGTALPTTISHSNDTSKSKALVDKSKQITNNTASKKEKKNKSTIDKNTNSANANGTANSSKTATKKTKKKKAKK